MIDIHEISSDETSAQPLVYLVMALLIFALTLILAARLAPQGNFVVQVDAAVNSSTSVVYTFDQRQWRSACPAIAAEVEDQIIKGCSNCATTAYCVSADSEQDAGRATQHENRPNQTLYFDGGRATFFADSKETAELACEASQKAIPPTVDNYPVCASTQRLVATEETRLESIFAACSVGAIILLLTAAIIGMSNSQRQSMGELEKLTTGHRQATSIVTFLTDTQASFLCWFCLSLGAGSEIAISLQTTFTNQVLLGGFVFIGWLHFGVDHYRSRITLHAELSQVFKAAVILGLAHTAIAAIGGKISAAATMLFWTMLPILIASLRYVLRWTLDSMDLWRRPALVIGRGENSRAARRALSNDFTLGYKTLRIQSKPGISDDFCELDNVTFDVHKASAVASKVKIVAALDSLQSPEAQKALITLLGLNRKIEIIPSLRGLPALEADISQFFGHELIMLSIHNKLARRPQRIFKRSFDIVISLMLLFILSPLLTYLILRIKSDGESAFFLQDRVGRNGNAFKCIKFRSMHVDAEAKLSRMLEENPNLNEEWQRNFKLADDPRVTQIGKVIRRYSLDELPQLINVVKGDMSLVGPRPLLFNELDRYGEAIDIYKLVAPGITGVWQVSGRSDTSFEQRREMDEWYIRNWNVYYDLLCLFRTIGVVVGSKGAY